MNYTDTQNSILPILEATKSASISIQQASDQVRKEVLHTLEGMIADSEKEILEANEKDLVRMDDENPKKDRLRLNQSRIQSLIQGLNDVAQLPDPNGKVLLSSTTEEGLKITKESVPLGVVGIIYESRPNVTIDVASLCLRSGNAVVLRGGSDALYSNRVLVSIIHKALEKHGLPSALVSLLPTDRELVTELLNAVDHVDIIIPRGSQSLIDFVRQNASVPTIETGAGVCHTYVHNQADLEKASQIVVNAKVSRPSVCNALDTVLVDEKVADEFLPSLIPGLKEFEVRIFADEKAFTIFHEHAYPFLNHAQEEDFGKEYLSFQCSVKVVSGFDEALAHIAKYSSKHSEAIITENQDLAENFLKAVDAAAVYLNASTRFTDGGAFGLGAEIGISTQKLHARGPFALEKLTTEKWFIRGNGQIRT